MIEPLKSLVWKMVQAEDSDLQATSNKLKFPKKAENNNNF
jgi:hypothetical protein